MLIEAAKLADFDTQLHVQDSVSGHQDQRLDHSVYTFIKYWQKISFTYYIVYFFLPLQVFSTMESRIICNRL